MTTPFKSISFNPGDTARVGDFNQLGNNAQYLFENLTKVRYSSTQLTRDTNLKILALRTPFSATSARQQRLDVYFNGFFTSGISPICVATAISHPQKRLIVTVSGLGGTVLPDSRGCMIQIEADEIYADEAQPGGRIFHPGYVDLLAVSP